MRERLKCKFCGWTCTKWRTNKKGERRIGFVKLREHIMEEHEELEVAELARQNQDERIYA